MGDRVSAGQLLAELDSNELQNQIRQEEINTDYFEKQIEYLQSHAELENRLEQLSLEELQSDYDTNSQIGSIPRMELEKQDRDIRRQELKLEIMEQEQENQLNAARRNLELSRMNLAGYRRELGSSRIYAPMDGLVVFLDSSEEGRYIRAREPFIRISNPGSLILQYDGRLYQSFSRGMTVKVSYEDSDYEGEVVSTPQDVPREDYQAYRETVRFRVDGLPGTYVLEANLRYGLEDDRRLPVYQTLNTDTSGLENHIRIVQGRMYGQYQSGGPLEVLITRREAAAGDLLLDVPYSLSIPGMDEDIELIVVGVWEPSEADDPYWFQGASSMERKLLVPSEAFDSLLLGDRGINLSRAF